MIKIEFTAEEIDALEYERYHHIIQKPTGIARSPTQVQAFLKRLGMKCRQVGYVPGRAADPDQQAEQETFKTQP